MTFIKMKVLSLFLGTLFLCLALTVEGETTSEYLPLKKGPTVPINNNDVSESGTVNNNGSFPEDKIDKHKGSNGRYYQVTTIFNNKTEAMKYWVEVESLSQHFVPEKLSNAYRQAFDINLPFAFPFFGQPVRKAFATSGGFLSMANQVHNWLAATEYIAPLMANFYTSNSSDSKVLYGYNATTFVVEWRNVLLKKKEPKVEFTFQCVLHINGDIAFVYRNVPMDIQDISDSRHPVKIGVSDAYLINKLQLYGVKRRAIYEYHKLDMVDSAGEMISNQTAILLTALPTCVSLSSCEACVSLSTDIAFNCTWCPSIGRCSDGFDRNRNEWISKQCHKEANHVSQSSVERCAAVLVTTPPSTSSSLTPSLAPGLQSTTGPYLWDLL